MTAAGLVSDTDSPIAHGSTVASEISHPARWESRSNGLTAVPGRLGPVGLGQEGAVDEYNRRTAVAAGAVGGRVTASGSGVGASTAQRAADEGVDLAGPGGLLQELTKQVLETGLEVDMREHLGHDKHDAAGRAGKLPQRHPCEDGDYRGRAR